MSNNQLDVLIWVLIYGGLLMLGLGLAVGEGGGGGTGATARAGTQLALLVAGPAAVLLGLVLVVWRSRRTGADSSRRDSGFVRDSVTSSDIDRP